MKKKLCLSVLCMCACGKEIEKESEITAVKLFISHLSYVDDHESGLDFI